ncbi:hypothetical protein EB796_004916 [Bugula neritina]|uniref:Palmitoyltransferase n=1 Tax=Bugula neritina TaxID=10212 RepID=A0A7J7KDP7_BUGNE|nr:hypothetical protein EB796_004916 [Bugula neritina]
MTMRSMQAKFIVFCNKNGPKILNLISPIWFLACILGLNWMAHDHIFDFLYTTESKVGQMARFLAWFMSAEMIINWIFLCTVRSTYRNTDENNKKRLEHEKTYPQLTSEGVAYEQLREQRPTLGTGNWSVVTQYTGSDVKRTAYPYWGWKPCVVCSFYRPPRCHHCPICEECVLKRDHHCFFARQCVGLNNQRFFVVFNFWAVMLTTFSIPQVLCYTKLSVWPNMVASELFLPWTIVRYVVGTSPAYTLLLVFQIYSLVFFVLTAGYFLHNQLTCIDQGLTSYEKENRDTSFTTTCKSRYERFACVFGRSQLWVNLFIPYHWASEPTDDGMTWQSMKKD